MKYKELGYSSLEEYKNEFYETLMPSNNTKDYFVNWNKVYNTVNELLPEIYLLNSLIKIDPTLREQKLEELLNKYPKIRHVIPLIIVVQNELMFLKIINSSFEYRKVDLIKDDTKEIVQLCKDIGILELFNSIKDLHDYLIGVGVGRDSNGRKNRSGIIFEEIVNDYLQTINVDFIAQDNSFEFKEQYDKKNKKPDFVIYRDKKPIALIEVNFYNTTGSKPSEVTESYGKLCNDLTGQIGFIWVTDGPAWKGMKNPLNAAFEKIDYVMNYKQFTKYFPELIKKW